MLVKSSDQVRLCRSRAYDARVKAGETADPGLKTDLLAMEQRWLALARSYEFSESLEDFVAAKNDRQDRFERSNRPNLEPDDDIRLHEISAALIQEGNLDALYNRILDAAIDVMRSDCGSMQIYHPERNELRLLASRGFHPESEVYWRWVGMNHHSTCAAALSAGRRIMEADTDNCAALAGTRDQQEYRRCGIRSVQTTPLLSRSGDLLGMISTHWRKVHLPDEPELRRLDMLARQAADLIERSKIEAQLSESEQKNRWFASIVGSTDDAIISTDLAGKILTWNDGAEGIFGFSASEAVDSPLTILIPPERRDEYFNVLGKIRAGEPFVRYETRRLRKDGLAIVVSLTISPVKEADGTIVGLSAIIRDITEHRRQEDQIAVLAREAEHRTKNLLSAVQAIINFSRAQNAEELKTAISGRIEALRKVHSLFAASRWTSAELRDLARQELDPFCDDGRRVHLDGPDVALQPSAAQGLAVVLHELTTNAVKYGALSTTGGHVDLSWSLAGDADVVMHWIESNGPPVQKPDRAGVGVSVIETMIGRQLQGEFRFDWRTEGLAFELKFRC